jgi:hypothetical protein
MESTNDIIKESDKEINQPIEAEESPFYSLIIKDLNEYYIRYDVLSFNLDNKFKSCVWYEDILVGYPDSELCDELRFSS